MRSYAFGLLALAANMVSAAPQGVTAVIAPPAPAPSGCAPSYSGKFQITVVNVTTKAKVKVKRDALELTLASGVLKDAQGRVGYIADNYQFQFDGPPQAGALFTAGFSVCGNGSLALGGSAIWYQCYSGGFYNLYDRYWAAQCSPIYINVIGGAKATGAASQATDGQVGVTTQVPQRSDGQGPGSSAAVSQKSDGQIASPTKTGAAVSQKSDGQIQAPTSTAAKSVANGTIAAPVTQISDGQAQAPTSQMVAKASATSSSAPQQVTTNAAIALAGEGAVVVAGLAAFLALL